MMAMMTIVWAWVTEEQRYARDSYGRPALVTERVAHACVWLNKGDAADLAKATATAVQENRKIDDASEHRRVLTYPITEQDPLGRARRDVLKLNDTVQA